MEKAKFFSNVASSPPSLSYGAASSSLGMEGQVLGELNCSSEQLPNCFLNLSVPFESALSSIVSSPATSNATVPSDSIAIRELIGRLGGDICNSREMSPQSYQTLGCSEASYIGGGNNISTNKSCYSTPFNSPPKLNLGLMDHHQAKGNLPISANSMSIYPSLATYSADPGFVERAAKFSCFGNQSFGGLTGQFGLNESEFPYRSMPMMENGQLLRVSSSQSFKIAASQMVGSPKNRDGLPLQDGFETEMRSASASASVSASDRKFSGFSRSSTPDNAEFANVHEKSSASEQIPGGDAGLKSPNGVNPIKRKAVPKVKAKDLPSSPSAKDSKIAAEDEDSNSKRRKLYETNGNDKDEVKAKVEANENSIPAKDHKQNKDNSKPPEPPKDYIHVRARRGQATDSHSLAERVRREKISERMKLLQDLVPGCNKVTGKAVMLDEIINYVQSLQRQVEFLSMKLATVNPRLDFNIETLLSKDILQMRGSLPHTVYPLDSSSLVFPYGHHPQQGPPLQSSISNGLETQCSVNPLDPSLCRNLSMQLPPADGFGEAASQVAIFWEDDLQSVVQMSFGQNQSQETTFQPESFHGSVPTAHMKVEL